MTRHSPFWLDRLAARSRPTYPRWRGEEEADVAVVGGGLTGCATAWARGGGGLRVVVLEAGRIGADATAGSAGTIREAFSASFEDTVHAYGLRAARALWQGQRRAAMDMAAALRRLQVRCDLAPASWLRLSGRKADDVRGVRREYQARRDAGLDVSWVAAAAVARESALVSGGAIRSRGFTFDPYRACLGLAGAATSRKARIFERSPAVRVRDRQKWVEIQAEGGVVRATSVVIATRARLADLRSLRRHLRPMHAYAVVTEPLPAAVRREVGSRTAAIQDAADPPHLVRWLKDERVLVAGADQPAVAPRPQAQVLAQRTGQLMYELSLLYPAISGVQPAWSWHTEYDAVADGLPCLGPHRNFPRHFFALGQGPHGPATAWLAARLALRWVQGRPDKGDDLFGFARIL